MDVRRNTPSAKCPASDVRGNPPPSKKGDFPVTCSSSSPAPSHPLPLERGDQEGFENYLLTPDVESSAPSPEAHRSQLIAHSSNTKVVLTGGAGFIGSHIADACVRRGWQVIILDDLSTGRLENIQHLLPPSHEAQSSKLKAQSSPSLLRTPPPLEKGELKGDFPSPDAQSSPVPSPIPEACSLPLEACSPSIPETHRSQLTAHSPVQLIRGSITNLDLLQSLFSGVDYVFHLAALASVPASLEDPLKSHQINLTGALNVLMAARDNHVKKVIFSSSAAVYGDTPQEYKQEDQLPLPLSPYAVHKLAAEHYCAVFTRAFGLPTACLRYFNVFGPRQSPHSDYAAVIPKFIDKLAAGLNPLIYGDGTQTRDFVFVKDVVAANLLLAESPATGLHNIGSGRRTTLNELAALLISLTGKDGLKPVYGSPRPGDIKHSLADIRRAQSIGFSPRYNLAGGLEEMLGVNTKTGSLI